MASPLGLTLLVLIASGTAACASRATPPDSTPVYADNIAPGVAPISVERLSVNRPEVEKIAEPADDATTEPSGATTSEPASVVTNETAGDQAPQGTTPADQGQKADGERPTDAATPEGEAAPK